MLGNIQEFGIGGRTYVHHYIIISENILYQTFYNFFMSIIGSLVFDNKLHLLWLFESGRGIFKRQFCTIFRINFQKPNCNSESQCIKHTWREPSCRQLQINSMNTYTPESDSLLINCWHKTYLKYLKLHRKKKSYCDKKK